MSAERRYTRDDLRFRRRGSDRRTAPRVSSIAAAHRRTIGRRTVFEPERDTRLVRVVGTHLHLYAVASGDLDVVLPEFAGNVPEDDVAVCQLNSKHGSWQDGNHRSFKFDGVGILGR